MILKLTPFQRFSLDNVLNQQEAKPRREQILVWGFADKIAFSSDDKKVFVTEITTPFGQEMQKLNKTAIESTDAKEINVEPSEVAFLSDLLATWKFSSSDRLWVRDIEAQLKAS